MTSIARIALSPSARHDSCVSHLPELLSGVSIVIPVGPGDESWRQLWGDVAEYAGGAQLLFVGCEDRAAEFERLAREAGAGGRATWLTASAGRARQLNAGAHQAERPHVWFLHCDSRISVEGALALDRAIARDPDALMYFRLKFQQDGPVMTKLNAIGVAFRSRALGMPFGDQGLCLRREAFFRLGGFNEAVPYGEDHLLTWAAKQHRIPLRCVDASISTSARKYAAHGWLSTTAIHLWRTFRQALPEAWRLLRSRLR